MRKKRFWTMFALFMAVLLGGSSGSEVIHAASKVENIPISRVTINFAINGEVYRTPEQQQGFIYKSRTYVPLRFAAYTLEQAVGWNPSTWTASVSAATKAELEDIQQINSSNKVDPELANEPSPQANRVTIKANLQEVQFLFFGKRIDPPTDLPTILYQGTLYVPFRFFAESLGIELGYDEKTRTVSADTLGQDEEESKDGEELAEDESGAGSNGTGIGNGGGQPGGPVTPKETYDTIISSTETSISNLEVSCANQLTAAYLNYMRAKTDDEKAITKAKGKSILNDCDNSFYALMDSLTKRLTDIGYDPEPVVNGYTTIYEQRKTDAFNSL